MSRNVLLVALLLATGIVLAEDPPETEPAAGTSEAEAQPDETATETSDPADDETKGDADAPEAPAGTQEGPKELSGMSILGNQEAPTSLVIVPWKSSEIGDGVGVSTMLDDSRQPVDREVFLRALTYYEIRSEKTP